MPNLDIDMFDEAPKIGDKVQVTGKIKSIDESSGQVEVSYDNVSILTNRKKTKNTHNDHYVETNPPDETMQNSQMMPNSQTLDQALSQSFPNTQ